LRSGNFQRLAARSQDVASREGWSLFEEWIPDLLAGETVPHPSGERNPVLEMTGPTKQKIYHLKIETNKNDRKYEQT
jgi:hypothetical protein